MSDLLTEIFDDATAEVDKIRNSLSLVDVLILGFTTKKKRETAARQVASCYVWLAAALEAYVKKTLEAIYLEINAAGIPYTQLSPRLFSLACNSQFDSLNALRNIKLWQRRIEIFSRIEDDSVVDIPTEVLPLDGRTIRPYHFQVIWKVFGFAGESIKSPRHKFVLDDLADGRNIVAHGEVDPVTFGRSKHIPDVIKITNYIDEIILHMTTTAEDYLFYRRYER
jgi:hypothetical protein